MNDETSNSLPAYHLFTKLGEYFVFDTSACHFYKIDKLTYKFLQLCLGISIEEAEKELIKEGTFEQQEIAEVAKEIKLLEQHGLFNVPDYSMSDEQIKKDLDNSYKIPIIGIELALAETCNLACTYCYCGTSRDLPNNGLMSEKIAHQSILWLFDAAENAKNKKINITFFGGEPLLNKPVIRSIVEYSQLLAKQRGKKVGYYMTTNATLLDDEFLAYAKKYNIDIMVSLDGPRKIHDSQCPMQNGKGSYDAATAGAKKLLLQHPANVRCTMAHPMPNLKELIDFFEDFGFKRSIIGPTINPMHSPSPVDFTEEDFAELSRQEEALIPWILDKITKKEKIQYSPFEKFLGRIPNCVPKKNVKKCGACHGCTYVGADGSLFPCHRFGGMKEWQVGHISNGPDYERYKKFWTDYRKSLSRCESCWAWPVCKGPCPWEILQADGTFKHMTRFCNFLKNRIECAAYIYAWKQEHGFLPLKPGKSRRAQIPVYNKSVS